MESKPYHHGNLDTELIEEGLELIHEEGMGSFSLRKLVKRIGVSPTACYNHYTNKEDLVNAMKQYVSQRFSKALSDAVQGENPEQIAILIGKAYVVFFAENPHYFSFIYDNGDYDIRLKPTEFVGDYEAFCIFKQVAEQSMQASGIPEKEFRNNLVTMWATVHGLAAMANMKGFHYDGDWGELAEDILSQKLDIGFERA